MPTKRAEGRVWKHDYSHIFTSNQSFRNIEPNKHHLSWTVIFRLFNLTWASFNPISLDFRTQFRYTRFFSGKMICSCGIQFVFRQNWFSFFHLESRFSLYSQRSIYNVRFGIFFFQLIYVYFVIYLILWTSHPEYGKIQFQDEHFDLMNDFDNEMNLKQRENISFSQQKLVDSTKSSINWLKFAFIKQAHFNSCSDGWIMYFTMWQRNKAQFFFVQFNQKYAHFEFLFSSSFHQFATARIESRRIVNR